jgi:hypothetical protein
LPPVWAYRSTSGQTDDVTAEGTPTAPRILALMGSGETAPTMVGTHRRLAALLSRGPATVRHDVTAALLDTPYGFQENATELADRAVRYFAESIDVDLHVAGLTRFDTVDALELERGLNILRASDYLFAGPGSPTYALRQWASSPVPDILNAKLTDGGILVFASAAALTIGRRTVPVYEIYKCGIEPHWLEGLDVLGTIGINACVIPHFDNAEGGHHDTRFCYLGERRLVALEAELPTDTWVLGIDEHTGLVIDLNAGRADVVGNGTVTIRVEGRSRALPTGTTIDLANLIDPTGHTPASTMATATVASEPADAAPAETSLIAAAERITDDFATALAERNGDAATRAALELETTMAAWAADPTMSDEADRARALLRSMISRLGEAASTGLGDPRDIVAPLVTALLDIRATARAERRFDLADLVRDRMTQAGIEVRDTPDGAEWDLL